jgi:catechol 2,3-dioxygenase-like lactoylglutathione lyase family enzyme
MTEHTNPSQMAHVSIGTNDFEKAVEFYDKVLGVLGAHRSNDFPGAVAWGKQFPEFWVQLPFNGAGAQKANATHFAFLAYSMEDVDKFHAAGLAAGASDDGLPGPRIE